MEPIYLDHCSTTPIDPAVFDSMLPFLRERFGNPGTPHHSVGGIVHRAVREAREQLAELINCRPNELIWTSGATEANNLAILGFSETAAPNKRHMVTQVTEHSAVLEPCRYLESIGWSVTYLPVDQGGFIDVDQLNSAITPATSFVSIMWGNNEIGTLQPVEKIAEICQERGVLFHCDAAQAAGKVPIDIQQVPISMLTLSAHKFYGPKGVGALFIRDLTKNKVVLPRVYGGGQEAGLRAGTQNVPAIVGMGAACNLARDNMSQWSAHTEQLRNEFESSLLKQLENVTVNGSVERRLPHISNLAFHGTENEGLLTMMPEIVASTGSACHVADFAPSHVLDALPVTPKSTDCSIRFGFGKDNTIEEVRSVTKFTNDAVSHIRSNFEQFPINKRP